LGLQATQRALAGAAHLRAAVSAKLRRRLQRTQQVVLYRLGK
jgi:hypothetical protein